MTDLERRAFVHLLDLDADERYYHLDDCMCLEIMPAVIHALEPDPVDATVAQRSLEDQTYPAQRFHTEKVGKFQGIELFPKTKKEHTKQLRKLCRTQLDDLEIVLRELMSRPFEEHANKQAMLEAEFPKLIELARMIAKRKKRTQQTETSALSITWAGVRDRLMRDCERVNGELLKLRDALARWGIR